jgi:hypothetical protein
MVRMNTDKNNLKIIEDQFHLCSNVISVQKDCVILFLSFIGVQANIIELKSPTWIIRDFSFTFVKNTKNAKHNNYT